MINKSKSILGAKDQTRLRIERMELEREERRRAMLSLKEARAEEEQRNIKAGNPSDVDVIKKRRPAPGGKSKTASMVIRKDRKPSATEPGLAVVSTKATTTSTAAKSTTQPASTLYSAADDNNDPNDQQAATTAVNDDGAEEILNKHMEHIQIHAELLSEEGEMLQQVQRPDVTDDEIDDYVLRLEKLLETKEDMILDLQRMIAVVHERV